ncbi:hypothetical protein FDP41_006619 [Naegleria fowleri]|uniref:TATA-binding protein interacting (TIP20) domain-containing protein n=1 Tax=Naegleria fowleri TaxID=5763 RepID=A0A6A5BBW5_NAEFO|nr:uncharacterized protein FDP41_006619 [Naegleria fowleri]KAF0974587.1 hypothetical protein FDP41_006619 [Naegleria fowleri]CAG4718715.1 unnamed protein product [Naegleria fowleri]
MSSFDVNAIIEKAESKDKDLRHMALYDLSNELQKENLKLDETSQRQLADIVLRLLDDKSSEVQGVAVKCLPPLVNKMSKVQIENSITSLSSNILKGEDEKRDIAAIALKTVISEIPIENALSPIKKCVNPLLQGLASENPEIKLVALDVLSDLLGRFGTMVVEEHEKLQTAFVEELKSSRVSVRKRAIACLAALSVNTNDKLFDTLLTGIVNGIDSLIKTMKKQKDNKKVEELSTYIQSCSAISKTAGHRFGKYLSRIIPLFMDAAEIIAGSLDEEDEEMMDTNTEVNDEVREYITQAFEAFVTRCPDEVTKYIDYVIIICKEYLEYDPNYSYDDSEDEAETSDAMVDEDEEDEGGLGDDLDEGGLSEDDDVTWKVRRSAAKCLGSLIRSRPEMLAAFYTELCSDEDISLIRRFKEREEPVKLDIFNVFIDLLHQSYSTKTSPSGDVTYKQHDEVAFVETTKDAIMKRIKKQLKEKSEKTKIGVFQILKALTITLQGGLSKYIKDLVPPICAALNEKGEQSSLKLETLSFLKTFIQFHKPEEFKPYLETLMKSVFTCVNDKYYKIITQALRVCGELVLVIKTCVNEPNFGNLVKQLQTSVFDKLKIQDIDQGVKESAITTTGLIVSHLSDKLPNLNDTLTVLKERLQNEITRLTAVRTFTVIAQHNVDISHVLVETVNLLSDFLRKDNRALRQAALAALSQFAISYKNKIDTKLFTVVINEAAEVMNEKKSDLHLAHLAFKLVKQIVDANPDTLPLVQKAVLPKILDLLASPTLQGNCLDSLLVVLALLVPSVGFDNILKQVLNIPKESKQVFTNIGKAVAAVCNAGSQKDKTATIEKFAKDLKSKDDSARMLALFTLGEIGRSIDLSSHGTVSQDIEACFEEEGSEELKNAASYALGNVSVGNLAKFLPQIIKGIRESPKKKYLLIHSLKEVITQSEASKLKPFIPEITPLLFDNSQEEEEGVRNVVSECLGKLAINDYDNVVSQLKEKLTLSDATRSTVIGAIKYAVTDEPSPIDNKLTEDLPVFLAQLNKNQPVSVRRAVVLLLNSVAHNKPEILGDALEKVLPSLYAECVFDPNLVRVIHLGPFTHKIDDGLDLRKSAFECMDTILDNYRSRIDPNKFIAQLPAGLDDENDDIKMLTHLIVQKCCAQFPRSLLTSADQLVVPFTNTLKKKLKDNALAQEKERHEELLRSALKAIHAIRSIPGIEDSAQFTDMFNKQIVANQKLKQTYDEIAEAHDEFEF